jgi:hypothetical protein
MPNLERNIINEYHDFQSLSTTNSIPLILTIFLLKLLTPR